MENKSQETSTVNNVEGVVDDTRAENTETSTGETEVSTQNAAETSNEIDTQNKTVIEDTSFVDAADDTTFALPGNADETRTAASSPSFESAPTEQVDHFPATLSADNQPSDYDNYMKTDKMTDVLSSSQLAAKHHKDPAEDEIFAKSDDVPSGNQTDDNIKPFIVAEGQPPVYIETTPDEIPENEKVFHEPEFKASLDKAIDFAKNNPPVETTDVDQFVKDVEKRRADANKPEGTKIAKNTISGSHGGSKNQQKQQPKNKQNKPQTQAKKPVDISILANLKAVIGDNSFNRVKNSKPEGFGKFTPKEFENKSVIINPEDDGVKNINIFYKGNTDLGRILEIHSKSPFIDKQLGKFQCVSGLQYFLESNNDERFRTVSGRFSSEERKKVPTEKAKVVKGIRTIIAEATWAKVVQNDKLLELILANDLPYVSYYITADGEPVAARNAQWYVPVIEEIARVIKLNTKNADACQAAGGNVKELELIKPDFAKVLKEIPGGPAKFNKNKPKAKAQPTKK